MGLFTSFQLRSRDASTRARAARKMGVAGRTANVSVLEPLLQDEDPSVRRAAVEALGAVGGEGVAQHLLAAARGAGAVRPEAEAAALRASVVEALAAVGEAAVPALLSAVSDRQAQVRECVIEALGRIGGRRAAEGLRQALGDERSNLRQLAAAALAGTTGAAAVPDLAALLQHRDAATRRAAAAALGATASAEAVDPLRRILSDGERSVRTAAVQGLAAIGQAPAIAALVGVLGGADRDLRQAAAQALRGSSWTPGDEGQRALRAALMGEFESVASAQARQPADDAVVGLLQASLAEKDPSVRRRAAEALGRLRAAGAAPGLVALLRDPDPGARKAAASALVALGPGAMEAVLPALEDRSATTRSAAREVLDSVGLGPVADHLIARLSPGEAAAHGSLPLRLVSRLEELDQARHAADALERLLGAAGAGVPHRSLLQVASLADLVLIEPGQVPDAAERLDLEELRARAARILAKAGPESPAPGAGR